LFGQIVELGDTAFIVLRKQPLQFLHWYHHITVMMYCFYSYPLYIASSRWYVAMNFFVHSAMYTYYAFKVNIINNNSPKSLFLIISIPNLYGIVCQIFRELSANLQGISLLCEVFLTAWRSGHYGTTTQSIFFFFSITFFILQFFGFSLL